MSVVRCRLVILLFVLNLFSGVVRADVLVLVHGWAANADTWLQSGVASELIKQGWQDAGVVATTPVGVRHYPLLQSGNQSEKKSGSTTKLFYRVQLPAAAPLLLQASHLTSELVFIQGLHSSEKLIVAGHSAGGVIARLVAIRPEYVHIKSLITIASPHLGTPRAFDGLNVVDSKPFFCPGPGIDFLKTVFGGGQYQYLKDSRGAMIDMAPVGKGTLLDWLNQQPHPDIQYHSIIHTGHDDMVPAQSQDMNQVPILRGRVKVYSTPAIHGLHPADGKLLTDIVEQVTRSK